MPANTPLGFPYPILGDAPNGPSQMQAMATAIDTFLTPATFLALGSASLSVPANTNIAFTATDDPESGWNASTHVWTCPTAGRYIISAQTRCGLTPAQPTCALFLNAGLFHVSSAATSAAGANAVLSIARTISAGTTVAIQSTAAYAMSATGQTDNWLSLARILS